MAFELHVFPLGIGETPDAPDVQRLDPQLARRVIAAMLERGIIALRSAGWAGHTAAGDVAAVADAMHNLPGFLKRADSAEGFDHRHFLAVSVLGVLRRGGPGSSDLMRQVGDSWMSVVTREYGVAVAEGLRAEVARQGFLA